MTLQEQIDELKADKKALINVLHHVIIEHLTVRCDECERVIEDEAPREPQYIVCDECEGEE